MKNFLALTAFSISVIVGLMLSAAPSAVLSFGKILHRDCVRREKITTEKPLFTFEEAKDLIGKKAYSKNPNFRKGEFGRIISLEMIGTDKFLIGIYWGKGVDDENSSLTFHDKEWFQKDFEFVN